MTTATAEKCRISDMRALVTISLPMDLNGEPFYMHRSPTQEELYEVNFYHCTTCLEQFNTWEDAQAHWEEK